MAFNSYTFILLFLPLALVGYRLFCRAGDTRPSTAFLLLCSLVFYGLFGLDMLAFLLLSAAFNYLMGYTLRRASRHRRLLLALALCADLGALALCKYLNFFGGSVAALVGASWNTVNLLIPMGISFFTFQQAAWLIDTYRGDAPPCNLLEYAAFVTLFPCITSGPIALSSEVIPQLQSPDRLPFDTHLFANGLAHFSQGLFKKVILADTLGAVVSWGFGAIPGMNTTNALIVMLCYTLQLYFDFSGYSDMARGVGFMFGLRLPQNFDRPYQALTISGFWKGWHMTMTRFFTRYLYIPLGGSRRGSGRTAVNTLVIFLVSGLWHGASWTFVLWGALHGVAMVLDRLLKRPIERLHPALSWMLTFGFVNVAWIFFRAPTIGAALSFCKNILRLDFGPIAPQLTEKFLLPGIKILMRLAPMSEGRFRLLLTAGFVALSLVLALQSRNREDKLEGASAARAVGYAVLAFWSVISLSGVATFLYANF